jgi:hypothetical protein
MEDWQYLLGSIWTIIIIFCKTTPYLPKFVPHLEEILSPCLNAVAQGELVDYDEDLFQTINNLIRFGGQITPTLATVFEILPALVQKYREDLGTYFYTICWYINRGDGFIIESPDKFGRVLLHLVPRVIPGRFLNSVSQPSSPHLRINQTSHV